MIGTKLYKGKFTHKQYAELASWCTKNNALLANKGEYYEVVENVIPQPMVEERLKKLEVQYDMPRVLREMILANPTIYSQFIVLRAKELEELAKEIRRKTNG